MKEGNLPGTNARSGIEVTSSSSNKLAVPAKCRGPSAQRACTEGQIGAAGKGRFDRLIGKSKRASNSMRVTNRLKFGVPHVAGRQVVPSWDALIKILPVQLALMSLTVTMGLSDGRTALASLDHSLDCRKAVSVETTQSQLPPHQSTPPGISTIRNPLRLYGQFCGPNPEINQIKNCEDPLARKPLDAADAVCLRHDLRYCACDMALTKSGRDGLPWLKDKGPFMALRTLIPDGIAKRILRPEYIRCIHEADVALIKERDELEAMGNLPADAGAMARMRVFQKVFEADLLADERWMQEVGGL
eukprot:CAMPEP_0184505388 /NCGR_PEP_ID=MMETSP0113_2-20130426/52962_1 /TAXON_ID=91329 /ORGANISM="Norrisiella sphaerica, Strain BC52" /LENGTH=301 /DNA_ID=CAMNT_0026895077 /DNA_START=81 /DNA_END=986 /DNA_ORIENTATION=+